MQRIVKANSRTPGVSGRDRRRLPVVFGRRSARLAMPKASRRRTRLAENHGKPSLGVFITAGWYEYLISDESHFLLYRGEPE